MGFKFAVQFCSGNQKSPYIQIDNSHSSRISPNEDDYKLMAKGILASSNAVNVGAIAASYLRDAYTAYGNLSAPQITNIAEYPLYVVDVERKVVKASITGGTRYDFNYFKAGIISQTINVRVPSHSKPGVFHTVSLVTNSEGVRNDICDCEGFRYRRSCNHIGDARVIARGSA